MTRAQRVRPLRLEELEPRLAPAAPVGTLENFDTTTPGTLPADWAQWSSIGPSAFAVSSAQSLSPPSSLAVSSPLASGLSARAWINTAQPANEEVQSAVYVNSSIPTQVLARGTSLDSTSPSFYAASVSQGLDLQLLRVQNGTTTTLGEVKSVNWFANQWAYVTLFANDNNLRAQVQRSDTGQYLNAFGQWQTSQAWALNLTDNDSPISGGGMVGLGRTPSYTGTVNFDDFSYGALNVDGQPPVVTITAPLAGSTVSGVTQVQAGATDNVAVTHVEFYIDGLLRGVSTQAPYNWSFDTTTIANGAHTLLVKAYDPAQNIGQATITFTTQNDFSALPRPTIPQHAPQIRLADLAYNTGSSQLDPSDIPLLQSSVDLVIEDTPAYLAQIAAVAPNTPQMLYTNVSSVYKSLLPDWLNYADTHGYSREEAFYHVTQAQRFSGAGGSTQPVNWFWGVYAGSSTLGDRTWQAHTTGFTLGGTGESVYIGYPDQFREINLQLASGASAGWSAALEYATAVDASGNPTAWAPLPTLTDTTAGLTQSGQITFDPPADWKTASVDGSAPLFYVRLRTLTAGTAPVAQTILGRDYVGANGTSSGVIPAFDASADVNHDGYLNNAEYANRAPGMDARFLYESRLFTYGQMRFVTNPGDAGFRAWAADYDTRLLNSNPLADGLFMDNSGSVAPVTAGSVIEPVGSYSTDYATLLYEIGRAIAPRWILANTAGGGSNANPTIQQVQGYFEEFAMRPLASSYSLFESVAAQVASRAALTSPPPYAVLDSYPSVAAGSSIAPTDPRMEMATLAYYYLLADPSTTFLDYDGGYDTTGPWSRHWFPAMGQDVGQPTGTWSVFASGTDPSNAALSYRIYQRSYSNALVLYKPLSYGNGVSGTLADATATTHELGGSYYPLLADGTLGTAVTSITLRNGEGAILIPVPALASLPVSGFPSPATAGIAGSFTVTATDSSGHAIPGYTGTVHFTSTDAAAELPADYTFTAADNGVHTFSAVFMTAGTQALTATDLATGVSGTQSVTVSPAAASSITVTAGNNQSTLLGSAFTSPLQVTVTDPYGNPVSGVSVSFTAPASGAGGTFSNGSTTITAVTDSNGQLAEDFTANTVTGAYTVTASVAGISTPASFSLSNRDTVQVALQSSASTSYYGQPVTFTATVTAAAPGTGTPTGTVTFSDGSTVLGTIDLSGGTASLQTSLLLTGSHSITALYNGDSSFVSGQASLTQTINADSTSTARVTVSLRSAVYGQPVTLSTQVSNATSSTIPAGTVTFKAGNTVLGTAAVDSSGNASLVATNIPVGSQPITAAFADPAGNFLSSSSPRATMVTVSKANTSLALAASTTTAVYSQPVTFTATATAASPSVATVTGSATFKDGSTTLATVKLVNGVASYTSSTLQVGSHSITASYLGTTSFQASAAPSATSVTVSQDSTSTSLTSSLCSTVYGQPVVLTAMADASSPGTRTPTGSVTFYDGTVKLGTGTLSGGMATLTTARLAVGSHSLTAVYAGNSNFTGSSSSASPVSVTVSEDGTSTTLTSSAASPVYGQSVMLTATVTANSPGTLTPTGSVTFYDGTVKLGTSSLSGGVATLTTRKLAVGSHSLTAVYAATPSYTGSTSAVLTLPVAQDGTITSLSASATSVSPGQSVTFTATVTANTPGSGVPGGTVSFDEVNTDGTLTLLYSGTLNSSGQATFTTSSLGLGSHTIHARYLGNSSYLASDDTTDAVVTVA